MRPRSVRRPTLGLLSLVVLLGLTGCQTLSSLWPFGDEESAPPLTDEELTERLQGLADFFETRVVGAGEYIARKSDDPEIDRRTVEWRLQAVIAARDAIERDEPLKALIDVWTLAIQQSQYFETGYGKHSFGEMTRVAQKASDEIWREAAEVGRAALPVDRYADVQGRLATFATEHPLERGFSRPAAGTIITASSDENDILGWVLSLPLKPAKAFLDDTARALSEFTKTTGKIARMVNFMPQRLSWELQLLLYDLEDRRTVEQGLASVEQVSSTVATLGSSVQALLDEDSPEREALKEPLGTVEHTVVSASAGLEHLATAGETWGDAVATTKDLVELAKQKDPDEPVDPDPQPARPFDITEYTATAAAIDSAGQTLTVALQETRGLVQDAKRVEEVLDAAEARLNAVLWRAFWGALLLVVALVGAITAGAIAYRAVATRLRARHRPPPPPPAPRPRPPSRTSGSHSPLILKG